MNDLRVLFSIWLLIFSTILYSQIFYSENIDTKDGLPHNAIRSIFQDTRGYIWVGTDAGVSRWDGEIFKNYNSLDGMAGNKVWCIDEDEYGNLWFACFGAGISKYDGKEFISFSEKDGLVDNSVRKVKYSTLFGSILIGTNKAISVFKDSMFYNFSSINNKLRKDVIITDIIEDSNKVLFFDFLNNHYKLFIDNDGKFNIELNYSLWLNKYGCCDVFVRNNGDTIIGWQRKGIVLKYSDSIKELKNIGQVFGMTEDANNKLYLASWNGSGMAQLGGLFSYEKNELKRLNSKYNINSIMGWSATYVENQNLFLYGTIDESLFKIPPQYFEFYPPEYFNEKELDIIDIEIDKENNKWFISDSLLVLWDNRGNSKIDLNLFYEKRVEFEKSTGTNKEIELRIETLNQQLQNNSEKFYDIDRDSEDKLWVAIKYLGFFELPENNFGKLAFHLKDDMTSFVIDESDTLFQFHTWLRSLHKFFDFKNSEDYISIEDSLNPIYSKKAISYKNEIWAFSRIGGVFMYNNGKLRTISSEDSSINKIVNDICFDENGYAYLGGNDGRVEILEPESRNKIFEIKNKEFQNSIYWLRISHGLLFVGYSDGLRVYEVEDLKNQIINYQYFGSDYGYKNVIVNNSAVDAEGNIWLATKEGLIKVNTSLFKKYKAKPLKIIIQKVELFNRETNWALYGDIDLWSGLPIEVPKLSPEENNISIYFNTLNYVNKADEYYYKLDGLDNDWVGPTDKTYVIYPYLNSGNYTFMVKSKNKSSQLQSKVAEFKFIILTPWYKEIWFSALLIALLLILIVTTYNIRVSVLRKKEEKKREIMRNISELESKALQAQMNPHFLFNSINSIQNYILDNDVDEALIYLNSFSRIIRMTLEFVDKKFISLSEEILYLEHYVKLENMRFDDLFTYIVELDKDIDPETTLVPPMLLQTLIENSIKHGIRPLKQKGHIKLEIIKTSDEFFTCVIEDNGVGREESTKISKLQDYEKKSKGLKIVKERLAILNNEENGHFGIRIIDLYSENGKSTGTKVEISMAFILS